MKIKHPYGQKHGCLNKMCGQLLKRLHTIEEWKHRSKEWIGEGG